MMLHTNFIKRGFLLAIVLFFKYDGILSQYLEPNGGGIYTPEKHQCLSDEDRKELISQSLKNIKLYNIDTSQIYNREVKTLSWPLEQSPEFDDPSYYLITNFVDHDKSDKLLDYNCNKMTYDGHKGTDIVVWPFMWYKQDVNQVNVIASNSGKIINKYDGNFDKNCECKGAWNAVYLLHDDGTVGWYGHLKKGTLTAKAIGQNVERGEYLGKVGSSGCSTAPHLHFELYENAFQSRLIDPFQGDCNALNSDGNWIDQHEYIDPKLLKIMVHDCIDVTQPDGCPADEYSMCESYKILPGSAASFSSHFRQQQSSLTTNYKIIEPDGTVWRQWNYNSPDSYDYGSYWYWWYNMPVYGPFGIWSYEVTFNGETTTKYFEYGDVTDTEDNDEFSFRVSPNPVNNELEISSAKTIKKVKISNSAGLIFKDLKVNSQKIIINVKDLEQGIYFVSVGHESAVKTQKIIINK